MRSLIPAFTFLSSALYSTTFARTIDSPSPGGISTPNIPVPFIYTFPPVANTTNPLTKILSYSLSNFSSCVSLGIQKVQSRSPSANVSLLEVHLSPINETQLADVKRLDSFPHYTIQLYFGSQSAGLKTISAATSYCSFSPLTTVSSTFPSGDAILPWPLGLSLVQAIQLYDRTGLGPYNKIIVRTPSNFNGYAHPAQQYYAFDSGSENVTYIGTVDKVVVNVTENPVLRQLGVFGVPN
ncbi:hypothetical protein MMC20_003915 [Loxospora ochrophaea]|nr:hypothetical protein [Loxospora ochrophaea]